MTGEEWYPEYHDGTGSFARGWFAHRARRVGDKLLCSSTGGPLDYVPLVVCDREAGRMIERIALPTQAEQLSVQIGPSEILVATQAGGWSLGRESSTIDGPAEDR